MKVSPALFVPELSESISTTVNSVPAGTFTSLGTTGAGLAGSAALGAAGFGASAGADDVAAVAAGWGVAFASSAEFDEHAVTSAAASNNTTMRGM